MNQQDFDKVVTETMDSVNIQQIAIDVPRNFWKNYVQSDLESLYKEPNIVLIDGLMPKLFTFETLVLTFSCGQTNSWAQVSRERKSAIATVLVTKGREYSVKHDRLMNFKSGAALLGGGMQECCLGYMAKHVTSIQLLVNSLQTAPPAVWEEKIGDLINYLILLKAIIKETVNYGTISPVPAGLGVGPHSGILRI